MYSASLKPRLLYLDYISSRHHNSKSGVSKKKIKLKLMFKDVFNLAFAC